jgi:hypothetical protein
MIDRNCKSSVTHWMGHLLALACLLSVGNARAWTSTNGALTAPIHQMAIDKVLASEMNASDRDALKSQQALADQDQDPEQSAEHAMTGITQPRQDEVAQRNIYIALSEDLVRNDLLSAINARRSNDVKTALPALGKALHALQDATSPSHKGFQIWSYAFGILEMAQHISKERNYPNDSAKDGYRSHLEGVVQFAYDIYMEKTPIPARFFATGTGQLLLPSSYLH